MPEASDDRQRLTAETRAKLRAEIARTGITAIMLLKNARDLPDGVDARRVNRWTSGLVREAPQHHIDYVLARWAALPDHIGRTDGAGGQRGRLGRRQPKADENWIEVTPLMRDHLRAELTRVGLTVPRLFEEAGELPFGLNGRVVNGWLYGEIVNADAACWEFVEAWLGSRPDNP